MDFSDRLEGLQQRAATAKAEVQVAAAESREQLRQRIEQAQSELNRSAAEAQQRVQQAELAVLDAIDARAYADELGSTAPS